MAKPGRIDTSGQANPLAQNPFQQLASEGFPDAPPPRTDPAPARDPAPGTRRRGEPNRKRGRVDVLRQTAGRGGKTVTVLTGFKGIAGTELHDLARRIQRACGTGGTVKGNSIEIQGDQRDCACAVLAEAGFQPVRAGG